MDTLATIVPIFLLILLGWFARQKGFIPPEFLAPANRLVYYFAIPAFVFTAISKASLRSEFHGGILLVTLAVVALTYGGVALFCTWGKVPPGRAGAMIQSAAHGNLGYIGLPFAFYFLGEGGLVKAGIISGFLMVLQNVLSVAALQAFSATPRSGGRGIRLTLRKLTTNPVIVSSALGIAASGFSLSLPLVLQRALDMLGGLAPPMALLLIGASLSFAAVRACFRTTLAVVLVKLIVLPALGLGLYQAFRIPPAHFLPGLILLACPTATVAYVMAREMQGDAEFIVATISASTLLSAVTFLFWMMVAGG